MRYLNVTQCRVPMARMQEFTTIVQKWEQEVVGQDGGPEFHAVYLNSVDPSRAMVITQFDSQAAAEAFAATGKLTEFQDSILACSSEGQPSEGWDLFYATGADGTRIIFGQDA